MNECSVSTVIPAYNAAPFLAQAIDSVLAQPVPVELIVVDDGSTDETATIARSYGNALRLIQQQQRGLGAARNSGVAAAACPWLAFLDADDRWAPDKLERQGAVFSARSEINMVFGHYVEFGAGADDVRWAPRMKPMPGYSACAMLVRRSFFDRIGGFSESLRIGEFIDWYARACDAGGRSVLLEDVVLYRRVHGSNMTALAKREQYLDVLRASLKRRRQAG